jgi:hypothetical protein
VVIWDVCTSGGYPSDAGFYPLLSVSGHRGRRVDMSDSFGTDDANLSELTDDDKLPADFPPDEPLGVDEYGTTAREQAVPEPLDERVAREEPDVPLGGSETSLDRVGPLVEPDEGVSPDETAEAVAREVYGGGTGTLASGDLLGGDPTTRDMGQERLTEGTAEEEAMHLTEPPPMGDGDGYVEDEV